MRNIHEIENYAQHKQSIRGAIKGVVGKSDKSKNIDKGETVKLVQGFLGHENGQIPLPPPIKRGKEPVEPTAVPNKDPDVPIELTADESKAPYKATLKEHWGYHLLVQIAEGNKDLDNPKVVGKFLQEMCKELEMRPMGLPVVLNVTGVEGRGVTAIQFITTSHISIHSDSDKMSAYIDIFSCAPYQHVTALKLIQKTFEPKSMGYKWLYRDSGSWPRKK